MREHRRLLDKPEGRTDSVVRAASVVACCLTRLPVPRRRFANWPVAVARSLEDSGDGHLKRDGVEGFTRPPGGLWTCVWLRLGAYARVWITMQDVPEASREASGNEPTAAGSLP